MDVDEGSSSLQIQHSSKAASPTVSQGVSSPHLEPGDGLNAHTSVDIDVDGDADGGCSSSALAATSSSFAAAGATPEANYEREVADITEDLVRGSRGRDVGMVVDTSTAVWNRTPRENTSVVEAQGGEKEHAEADNGPMRKKRKSDVEATVDRTEQVAGPETAKRQRDFFVIGSLKPRAGMKIVVSKQKEKVSVVNNTREQLRDRLVGFARSGSQLPVVQHLEQEGEDVDLNMGVDGDEDEGSDEEVDQLDASSDNNMQEEAPVTVNIPNKTQPLFDESRPSTPTETQLTGEQPSTFDLTTEDDMFDDSQLGAPIFDPAKHTPSSALLQEVIITRPEVIRSTSSHTGDVSLRFDLSKISASWHHLCDRLSAESATASSTGDGGAAPTSLFRVPSDAGVSNTENDDRAVDALARVIEKQDFATMDVVGQFNLGFIVARRRKPVAAASGQMAEAEAAMDDLFIVDQHAADEKYNFETLQQTTSIKSQKLFRWVFFRFSLGNCLTHGIVFRPQAMELTASDELLAIEHMDVLRQNGFEVEVDDQGECGQGSRLKLTAQPISKSTVFDTKGWSYAVCVHFLFLS
jgi:DNA mismatch repair protein PMS2